MIAQKAPSLDECLWVMATMLHDQMSGKVPVKESAHTVHIGSGVCMCMSHVCVRGLVPCQLFLLVAFYFSNTEALAANGRYR